MQRYRSVHGVLHPSAGPSRLDQVLLQREIPFRGAVGVINQHQPRIVFQPFRLLDHGLLILPQEHFGKCPKDGNRQWQIPGSDEVLDLQPGNREPFFCLRVLRSRATPSSHLVIRADHLVSIHLIRSSTRRRSHHERHPEDSPGVLTTARQGAAPESVGSRFSSKGGH